MEPPIPQPQLTSHPPSQNQNQNQNQNQAHLNRACESCRLLKVRCLIDDAASTTTCIRCAKAKRQCVFAAPLRRRPRKRVEGRVAELERELSAMRAALRERDAGSTSTSNVRDGDPDDGDGGDGEDAESYGMSGMRAEMDGMGRSEGSLSTQESVSPIPASEHNTRATNGTFDGQFTDENRDLDVVDRGRISMAVATHLVRIYVDHCMPLYPAVILPQSTTASDLRSSKPVLFLSVIAAASLGGPDPDLSKFLNMEILRLYADRLFIKGEKSLELVQSLLITVAFYYPPGNPEKLQFYQYIHIAVTMAVDIGIVSINRGNWGARDGEDEAHMAEISRTVLRCYVSAASMAARMRRPPMLAFNNWMGDCLKRLEKSSSDLDRRLAAWVKLQRIADEVSTSFGFDDPSTTLDLTESRLHVILKAFERRMEDWKRETSPNLIDIVLTMEYHLNMIFVYEFVMSGGKHDMQDFKKKHFTLIALDAPYPKKRRPAPTADQLNATMKCIDSCHVIIDTFLNVETPTLRLMMSGLYVSAMFSLLYLLKISWVIGTSDGGLGDLVDIGDLKLDKYIEETRKKLEDAEGGPMRCRLAEHWRMVTDARVQKWHDKHQQQMRESSMERKGDGDEALGFPPVGDRQAGAQQDSKWLLIANSEHPKPFQEGIGRDSQMQQITSQVSSQPNASTRPDGAMEWKSDIDHDDVFLFQNDTLLGDTDLFDWMDDGTLLNELPGW